MIRAHIHVPSLLHKLPMTPAAPRDLLPGDAKFCPFCPCAHRGMSRPTPSVPMPRSSCSCQDHRWLPRSSPSPAIEYKIVFTKPKTVPLRNHKIAFPDPKTYVMEHQDLLHESDDHRLRTKIFENLTYNPIRNPILIIATYLLCIVKSFMCAFDHPYVALHIMWFWVK